MLAAWFCIDTGKSDKGKQVKSATCAQRTNRLRATYTQDKQLKYTSSLLTTVRKANRILRQLFGYIFFFSQFFFFFWFVFVFWDKVWLLTQAGLETPCRSGWIHKDSFVPPSKHSDHMYKPLCPVCFHYSLMMIQHSLCSLFSYEPLIYN